MHDKRQIKRDLTHLHEHLTAASRAPEISDILMHVRLAEGLVKVIEDRESGRKRKSDKGVNTDGERANSSTQ